MFDGTVYVTGGRGEGSLFAFDLNGRLLWRRAYGRELASGAYAGPRCDPLIGRDVTILTSSLGDVYASRTDSQARLWSFNLFLRYGGRRPAGGYSATPLRFANKVIFACGGGGERTPSVVAVDCLTGDTLWTASSLPGDSGVGDSSPALLDYPGGAVAIAPFVRGILALDPATGRRLWGWNTVGGGAPALPVCWNGLAYTSSHGGRMAAARTEGAARSGTMLRVSESGGYLELWRGPEVYPRHAALTDGKLYVGDACYDAVTGRLIERMPGVGGLIGCGDGTLCYLDDGPRLSLVEIGRGAMRVSSRFVPHGIGARDLWVPPVLAEGRIFVRDRGTLSAYDLRTEPESAGPRLGSSGRHAGPPPPVRWDPEKNVLWRARLPVTGLSAPVVHGGRVFMAGEPGSVVCCDAANGAVLWMRDANPKADRRQRTVPVMGREPVVSGDRVWARFSDGTVQCLTIDGTPVWSASVGACSNESVSAVLSDGILVLGGNDIVGLDASGGTELWRLRAQGQVLDVAGKAWLRDRGVVISSAGHLIRSRDGTVVARDLPPAASGCVATSGFTVYAAVPVRSGYVLEAYMLPPQAERGLPVRSTWKVARSGSAPATLSLSGKRVFVETVDGVLHVHDTARGAELLSIRQGLDHGSSNARRQLWQVADLVYAAEIGGTGLVHASSADTGEPVWSFRTAEPLTGMAFVGGRQFIRSGSVLHCIGGVTPSRVGAPTVLESPADAWLRSRGRRPIVRVVPGEMPRFWLYNGPFAWQHGADPFREAGGLTEMRPNPGDEGGAGSAGRRFVHLRGKDRNVSLVESEGGLVLDFAAAIEGVALPCAYYMFTTIENLSSRWVVYSSSVATPQKATDESVRTRAWIGGSETRPGDIVHLQIGRTSFMVEVVIESPHVAGRSYAVSPGFLDVDPATLEAARAADRAWKAYEAASSGTFVLP